MATFIKVRLNTWTWKSDLDFIQLSVHWSILRHFESALNSHIIEKSGIAEHPLG